MASYKDTPAYQRSQRLHPDGTPVFPLPFLDRRKDASRGVGDRVWVAGEGRANG